MRAHARTVAITPPLSLHVSAGHGNGCPLTHVSLAYLEQRLNLYLRFGHPTRTIQLDRWRRCAVFLPTSVLCRIRWESNDYGTTRWQLMVMQACTPLDGAQRIPGVRPGARLLLHAEGERQVRAVLPMVDAIEVQGIDPSDVSPVYWCALGNRLSARLPLPVYTAQRHAAWRAGRTLQ